MSENTTGTVQGPPEATAATQANAQPEPVPDTPEGVGGATEPESGNGEAAKYRRRLRAAEAERDTLTAQVQAMQRAEAERVAAVHLSKPAALWAGGAELGDVLADDGTVDPDRVEEAARAVVAELGVESPSSRLRRGNYVPREGGNPDAGSRGGDMAKVIMGGEG